MAQSPIVDGHDNLGNAPLQLGRIQDAVGHYDQTERLKPDYAEAHCNLGVALERAGNVQEAIDHYEEAVWLEPNFTDAQSRLSKLRVVP